jgi:hypothetical protein
MEITMTSKIYPRSSPSLIETVINENTVAKNETANIHLIADSKRLLPNTGAINRNDKAMIM